MKRVRFLICLPLGAVVGFAIAVAGSARAQSWDNCNNGNPYSGQCFYGKTSSNNITVEVYSTDGTAVFGNDNGSGTGGAFGSLSGYAVSASSGSSAGVYGTGKVGVQGISSNDSEPGVWGEDDSSGGYGVYGTSSASNGIGVYGYTSSASGGTGVYGIGYSYGVYGTSSGGPGVYGASSVAAQAAVYGYNHATNGAGVEGDTADGYAVIGNSTESTGVYRSSGNASSNHAAPSRPERPGSVSSQAAGDQPRRAVIFGADRHTKKRSRGAIVVVVFPASLSVTSRAAPPAPRCRYQPLGCPPRNRPDSHLSRQG